MKNEFEKLLKIDGLERKMFFLSSAEEIWQIIEVGESTYYQPNNTISTKVKARLIGDISEIRVNYKLHDFTITKEMGKPLGNTFYECMKEAIDDMSAFCEWGNESVEDYIQEHRMDCGLDRKD